MNLLTTLKAAAREPDHAPKFATGVPLTAEQLAALNGNGKTFLNGGPGVGKSTVLVARLAKYIDDGADPTTCLVVSFSRRTCGHLAQKIASALDARSAGQVKVWTLHKLAMSIVDEFWDKLSRSSKPKLIDDRRMTWLMRSACKRAKTKANKEVAQRLSYVNEDELASILKEVSWCKANLMTTEEYAAKARTLFEQMAALVYAEYEALLLEENGLDFGGYVMAAGQLLDTDEEVRGLVQEMHSTVLADELQDVDLAMFSLLALIVWPLERVFIAIDPDQSVYGFRSGLGALAEQYFRRHFPEAEIFGLRANARNPGNVVQQANICRRDPDRVQQALRPAGAPLYFVRASSEHDEQAQLGDMIERALATGRYRRSDIAVLCRNATLLESAEAELLKRRIAHTVVGRDGFFDRKEIRQIMAYVHLALGDDLYYLMEVINTPARGLDKKALDLIRGQEPEASLKQLKDVDGIRAKAGDVAAEGMMALWQCLVQLQTHTALIPVEVMDLIIGEICEYGSALSKDADEKQKQMVRIQQLYQFASGFQDLRRFVQAVDEMNGDAAFVENQDEVQVMTMHAAKGLEFPIVFILGMENGIVPHYRALQSDHELAAERRLLVMAMTRAQEYLIFLRAHERNGRKADTSPFSTEFTYDLFDHTGQPDFLPIDERTSTEVGDG